MADYLKFGYEHHVRHYYAEAYPDINLWSEGPKFYVLAKLLWNPYANVDALLQEWYVAASGKQGAPYLKQYFDFWEDFWTNRVPHSDWFKLVSNDYLDFTSDAYMELLTSGDRENLTQIMQNLKSVTRNTKYEKRAIFLFNSWKKVEEYVPSNMLDPNIKYDTIFLDDIEGDDGEVPSDWSFWNRPNVDSVLIKKGLTKSEQSREDKSFEIILKPDGKKEAYAVLYKKVEIDSNTRVCLSSKVKSLKSKYIMSLSTHEKIGGVQKLRKNYLFKPTGNNWKESIVCIKLKNNTYTEVGMWLGIKSSKGEEHQVLFDDVKLLVEPAQ